MSSKSTYRRLALCLILAGLVATVPAFAGSAVIGSVAGSMNATVGGQTLLPNTTLFSGDNLQVKDGVAVVALGSTSRLAFGRDTVASFLRDYDQVSVLLSQGSVSVFHAEDGDPIRVKVGDVTVVPVSGFRTFGEVAMLDGAVVVTTKQGMLRVEGNGPAVNVVQGKTITVAPKLGAPQPGGPAPAGGSHVSGEKLLEVVDIIVSAGALITGAWALSKSSDASSNALSAESAAAAAASSAAAAASEAAAALSAANAATIAAGCALNAEENEQGQASSYTPPTGVSCSNSATW
jgi:hypothetical protein